MKCGSSPAEGIEHVPPAIGYYNSASPTLVRREWVTELSAVLRLLRRRGLCGVRQRGEVEGEGTPKRGDISVCPCCSHRTNGPNTTGRVSGMGSAGKRRRPSLRAVRWIGFRWDQASGEPESAARGTPATAGRVQLTKPRGLHTPSVHFGKTIYTNYLRHIG
jgi:hypothetical protein